MTPLRIFISSVQKEFAGERKALANYLRNDPLIRRCAAANLPEPEFVVSGNFVTTIRRPDYATQLAKVQGGVQAGVQAWGASWGASQIVRYRHRYAAGVYSQRDYKQGITKNYGLYSSNEEFRAAT